MTRFMRKLFTCIIGSSVSITVEYLSEIMAAGITTIYMVLSIVTTFLFPELVLLLDTKKGEEREMVKVPPGGRYEQRLS